MSWLVVGDFVQERLMKMERLKVRTDHYIMIVEVGKEYTLISIVSISFD